MISPELNTVTTNGLTKFQKQLAQEYVTAYFASKKSVFKGEYFWSAKLASKSVDTLDEYMDALFSSNKYKDVAPLFAI